MSNFERRVDKFGGTSMAQPGLVAEIVEQQNPQFVVVSAPGKEPGVDTKMTDTLLSMSFDIARGNKSRALIKRDEIIDRFDTLYADIEEDKKAELRSRTSQIISAENPDSSYNATRGELVSALYFGALIGRQVIERPPVVFSKDGKVDLEKTIRASKSVDYDYKDQGVIIPGFFGYDSGGVTHTLGRGGSDRTPAFISRALGVDYTNWTDVDGIASADPRVVGADKVKWLDVLTRDEVREGANNGSGVLQGGTIVDLADSDAIVSVKNTFKPNAPGTRVVKELEHDRADGPVVSVTGRNGLVDIFINQKGISELDGFIADIAGRLATIGFSIEYMPMSRDTANIVGETDSIEHVQRALHDINHSITENVGLVALVGEGLKNRRVATEQLLDSMNILNSTGIDNYVPLASDGAASIAFLLEDCSQIEPSIRALHESLVV